MSAPSLDQIIGVLAQVTTGEVEAVDPEALRKDWATGFCGHPKIKLTNGWTLIVFQDCGDWDYIDMIEGPGFEIEVFEQDNSGINGTTPMDSPWWTGVVNWEPPERWGL